MGDYIDREEAINTLIHHRPTILPTSAKSIMSMVPAADVVEVIRCKDCVCCVKEEHFGGMYYYCDAIQQHAEGEYLEIDSEHFCSWGERGSDG